MDKERLAQEAEQYRPLLFSIAYRMLGAVREAEDVVQDTLLQVLQQSSDNIQNLRSYLIRAVTNQAINRYQQARQQRENYTGTWLPEPVVASTDEQPDRREVRLGLLMLMENLNPYERAVYVLRELFGFDYEAVAHFTDTSYDYCRQLLKRAKSHLQAPKGKNTNISHEHQEHMLQAFIKAMEQGDFSALRQVLHEDIVLYSDGGGKVQAAIQPLHTFDKVSRFLFGIQKQNPDARYQFALVNEQPGIIIYNDRQADSIFTFDTDEQGMTALYIVRNPDKLRQVPKF